MNVTRTIRRAILRRAILKVPATVRAGASGNTHRAIVALPNP